MRKTKERPEIPAANVGFSFQISGEPVVKTHRAPEQSVAKGENGFEAIASILSDDALHILARDPESLFIYWNLDWDRRFAAAGLSARPVRLRVFREDESEENTTEIDPLIGFSFVSVGSPVVGYRCEIGCFDGEDWKSLARSEAVETPAATMSEEAAADFATLPIHLTFQRLIDIFRSNSIDRRTLSQSVSKMQSKARALQASMSPEEWSQTVDSAENLKNAKSAFGLRDVQVSELASLLQTVKEDSTQQIPSPENLARWRQLGERFGGSSWSGGSSERSGNFDGSSRGGPS